jgi:hypothetical protein
MRKLLLSAITLFLFSASIFVFQVSCQKDAVAENNQINEDGFILLEKESQEIVRYQLDSAGNNNPIYEYRQRLYKMKYDGTNLTEINLNLPSNYKYIGDAYLNPQQNKLVFRAITTDALTNPNYTSAIFISDINGNNVVKIKEETASQKYQPIGAY